VQTAPVMLEGSRWPSLVATALTQAARRAARGAGLGAALGAAFALALHPTSPGEGGLGRALAFALGALYVLVGAIVGAALAGTFSARQTLSHLEAGLHALVQPAMTRVIASTRLGQHGMSTRQFEQLLDVELAADAGTAEPRGVARSLGVYARRLARRLLVRDFLDGLQRQGQSQVTPAALEAFAREKLVGLLVDRVRAQVAAVRWTAWAIVVVAIAGPLGYRLLAR
jgi:hypothetical protein